MDFIEPCFGIGHNLSLICQMTSEDIKHQLILDYELAKNARIRASEKNRLQRELTKNTKVRTNTEH